MRVKKHKLMWKMKVCNNLDSVVSRRFFFFLLICAGFLQGVLKASGPFVCSFGRMPSSEMRSLSNFLLSLETRSEWTFKRGSTGPSKSEIWFSSYLAWCLFWIFDCLRLMQSKFFIEFQVFSKAFLLVKKWPIPWYRILF